MDFPEILLRLNELPATFMRRGPPYTNFVEALASALFLYTSASDGLFAQTNFATAANGWIDVWGALAGIERRVNESDVVFQARIANMVLCDHASVVAIVDWLSKVEQITGSVTEYLPGLGYQITVPPTLLISQIKVILRDLAYVRPAGVPFYVVQTAGATYLDTVNYLGAAHITGAYLAGNTLNVASLIPGYTTNARGLLPDLLFTDPLINPGLPPQPDIVETPESLGESIFTEFSTEFSFEFG